MEGQLILGFKYCKNGDLLEFKGEEVEKVIKRVSLGLSQLHQMDILHWE